ncbi:hypothetical protein [Fibrobacter succinogenes]|uniref:hypothetical protein n=1 Tax=Fibrobacter succinogenes TaxID=833 RepID=UPI0015659DC5|nr:hypothetical protein [Fibrobacter succinogenes]
MRNGMNKLLAVTAVLACVCMWGCFSWFEDETTMSVSKKRTEGYLTAFVNDSLAIVWNGRVWGTYNKSCDYYDSCEKGTLNQGVFLVNYREKRPPLWGDTVDGKINIVEGFYSDSSVMFFNDDEEFGFWKIGGDARVVRKWKWEAPCKWEGYGLRASAWIDGKILMKDAFPCGFAILDTATGNVSNLERTGEYAWLEGCDDITYIDGEALCLKALYDEDRYGVYEYGKDGLIDSLIWNDASWSIYTKNVLEVWGGMFTIKHPTAMMNGEPNLFNGTFIHYLKPLGTPILPMRMEYDFFVDSMGTSIGYSSEDLVIAK